MMEMIIIVQVFPKKTIYLHSARPVVALWQRAVHRLPYPRLAGEKVDLAVIFQSALGFAAYQPDSRCAERF